MIIQKHRITFHVFQYNGFTSAAVAFTLIIKQYFQGIRFGQIVVSDQDCCRFKTDAFQVG